MVATGTGCWVFLVNICQIKYWFFFCWFLYPCLWWNPQIPELMHLLSGLPLGKVTVRDLQEANVSICKCENFHQKPRSVSLLKSCLTLVSNPNWVAKVREIPAGNQCSWVNDNEVVLFFKSGEEKKENIRNYCLCFTLRHGSGHLALSDWLCGHQRIVKNLFWM